MELEGISLPMHPALRYMKLDLTIFSEEKTPMG